MGFQTHEIGEQPVTPGNIEAASEFGDGCANLAWQGVTSFLRLEVRTALESNKEVPGLVRIRFANDGD